MMIHDWLILGGGGLFSGLLAGLLGIGGGTVLVPMLIAIGYNYAQSVATSSLAIVMTSISGTLQNWRMGFLKLDRVLLLGIPGIASAQLGAYLVGQTPKYILEMSFGFLLLFNIYLTNLRQKLVKKQKQEADQIEDQRLNNPLEKPNNDKIYSLIVQLGTGGSAGLLAGLFGVGGGVIMVPLQMLFLKENIKSAIQSSLGVIVITSISACLGHSQAGNVLWRQGLIVGIGGLIGAQISTRFLPKLPERFVRIAFKSLLIILAISFLIRAWFSYQKNIQVFAYFLLNKILENTVI